MVCVAPQPARRERQVFQREPRNATQILVGDCRCAGKAATKRRNPLTASRASITGHHGSKGFAVFGIVLHNARQTWKQQFRVISSELCITGCLSKCLVVRIRPTNPGQARDAAQRVGLPQHHDFLVAIEALVALHACVALV